MIIERTQKILLAIIVGIALFCLEMAFGIFTAISLRIGGSLLILIIIGMLAGGPKEGVVCTLAVLAAMIPIGLVLWPFLELPFQLPENTLVAIMTVMMLLVWRTLMLEEPEEWGVGILQVILFLISPIIYIGGIFIGGIGGFLGPRFWNLFEKKSTYTERPSRPVESPTGQGEW
ncbi:MAG: hypothetical protein ACTSV2_00280 [Candidatus Thorarchaeota archaeon]